MNATAPSTDHLQKPLPPPRFSLRALLVAVTLFCCLLGLSHWVSPNTLVVVILLLLVVGAHVLGNALGTRLRDGPTSQPPMGRPVSSALEHHDYAPTTHLSSRHSLRTTILISSICGTLAGMIGGYCGMSAIYPEHLNGLALAITLIAFGILGGVAAFLLGTFVRVLFIALRQSHTHQ